MEFLMLIDGTLGDYADWVRRSNASIMRKDR
jgi:hypothetical protein